MKKVLEFLCGSLAVTTIGSLAACAGSSTSGTLPPGYVAPPVTQHASTRKPQYCNYQYVGQADCSSGGGGDGGGDYGGGGSENYGGGGGGGGGQVATLGPAKQGVPCTVGGGGTSAPIGSVIDGKPDTRGSSGNEVNNVYYLPYSTGTNTGSVAGYFGFIVTTFNNEYWYEPPITVPGTTSPIYVNMGNISIAPDTTMTAQTFTTLVNQALGGTQNGGLSSATKTAVGNFLTSASSKAGTSGSSSIDPCFDGPWNGQS